MPSKSKRRTYEIVVRGELTERFASTFLDETFGAKVRRTSFEPEDGTTAVEVEVIDQAQLIAVLESLRDLSLEIERVSPAQESERKRR